MQRSRRTRSARSSNSSGDAACAARHQDHPCASSGALATNAPAAAQRGCRCNWCAAPGGDSGPASRGKGRTEAALFVRSLRALLHPTSEQALVCRPTTHHRQRDGATPFVVVSAALDVTEAQRQQRVRRPRAAHRPSAGQCRPRHRHQEFRLLRAIEAAVAPLQCPSNRR
jgi:hypothetical protein